MQSYKGRGLSFHQYKIEKICMLKVLTAKKILLGSLRFRKYPIFSRTVIRLRLPYKMICPFLDLVYVQIMNKQRHSNFSLEMISAINSRLGSISLCMF